MRRGIVWLSLSLLSCFGCYRSREATPTDATADAATPRDADAEEASSCRPSRERCDARGTDEDCDGRVDEHTCPRGESCSFGECSCDTRCGSECVDVDRDPNHCGGCGVACEPGTGCIDGVCCTLRSDRVDLLFVVENDDSEALRHQARLRADLMALLRPLTSGDHDGDGTVDHPPVADLNVGVVTMDMGGSREVILVRCGSGYGHDGILRRGREFLTELDCSREQPPVHEWRGSGDLDEFTWQVGCAASLGTNECALLQPLEAGLKALTPSTSPIRFFDGTRGHGDGANAEFLRSDSFLVVIVVSAEDDCSARDPRLYDLYEDASQIDELCVGNPEWRHAVSRYVEGFAALRPPERFHFAVLGGVPPDRVTSTDDYSAILSDPRMVPEIDPGPHYYIRPLCQVVPPGDSWPAVPTPRLVQVAAGLANAGYGTSVASLCTPDFVGALETIALRVGERLSARCE